MAVEGQVVPAATGDDFMYSTDSARRARLLLVGSGTGTSSRLETMLSASGFDVRAASGLAECLEVIVRYELDVVVIELTGSPLDTLTAVIRLTPAVSAPVITIGGVAGERVAALDGGALLALPESMTAPELEAQIGALCRHRPPHRPVANGHPHGVVAGVGSADGHDEPGHPAGLALAHSTLTALEWKLFAVLSAEPGRFFAARELLELVWGYEVGPVATVAVHIHRVRRKMVALDDLGEIVTVRGRGYAYCPFADPSASALSGGSKVGSGREVPGSFRLTDDHHAAYSQSLAGQE